MDPDKIEVADNMLRRVLFLFLLGVWTHPGAPCPPDTCRCKQMPYDYDKNGLFYTVVECDGYSESLVDHLDNTTRVLRFSHMNDSVEVDSLIVNLVNEFEALKTLSIADSAVGNYTFELENLNLDVLDLQFNRLQSVPEIIQNKSTIRTLDLSNNALIVLESDPFRTLRTLELLNLSANSLTAIGSDSLTGLINLKCLDLSANNLTQLDDKVLLPVTNLQYLNLSSNKLEVLNEVSFSSLTKLQQLDVSWNRLARVAPGSLELPSLARLLLAGNPALGGSREVLVGSGHRLQTVDASRTGLKQVPAALTHSIRTLRLAGNSIREVRRGDLDSYPLLQLLDFTSNELASVEEDALGRLESLSILYFTDNNIEVIPRSLPEDLKVLHLEHNTIKKVSAEDLLGLGLLEVLLLNDNKISVVEQGAFSQLTALVALDLSRNPVTILEAGCLTGPAALEVLRLSSIGIVSVAKETAFPLSTPEHLISLDLSDSPGLARQFLGDTAALAASRALQELDVSRTALQFIRNDLLHFLPQLRVLHIKHNELDCEDLGWLAAWMRSKDTSEYGDVICNSPAELWGTPLVDLPDVESTTTTTTTQSIKETADDNVEEHTEFNYTDLRDLDKIDIRKKTIHFILTNNVLSELNDSSVEKLNDKKKENKESNLIAMKNIIVEDYVTKKPIDKNQIIHKKKKVNKELVKDSTNFYVLGVQNITTPFDFHNFQQLPNPISENITKTPTTEKQQDDVQISQGDKPEKEPLSSQWNPTPESSSSILHPGMMILGVTVMVTIAVLVMLTAKYSSFRRRPERLQRDDIEVSSLPGVTELW